MSGDNSVATASKEVALTRAGTLRLDAIDLQRGLVIVLMVLDHVRDYVHAPAFVFSATDLTRRRCSCAPCARPFFLVGVSL